MSMQEIWSRFVSAVNAVEGETYEVRTKRTGLVCTGVLVKKENVRLVSDEDRPYIKHCVGDVYVNVNGETRVFDLDNHELYLPPRYEPIHGTASVLPNNLE